MMNRKSLWQKVTTILLLSIILLNLGWIGWYLSSNAYVPVPEGRSKIENGRVFVHMNWYRGGDFFWIPMISAVLGLATITALSLDRMAAKK